MLINLIVLKVQDIEQTCQFYNQFGLVFKSEQHENGPEHYSCNINGLI
ncbi:hypothetical protein [Acinetobacter wuhouensis]|nr:hypothetical protein [Acinetobacter wuhouensis]